VPINNVNSLSPSKLIDSVCDNERSLGAEVDGKQGNYFVSYKLARAGSLVPDLTNKSIPHPANAFVARINIIRETQEFFGGEINSQTGKEP